MSICDLDPCKDNYKYFLQSFCFGKDFIQNDQNDSCSQIFILEFTYVFIVVFAIKILIEIYLYRKNEIKIKRIITYNKYDKDNNTYSLLSANTMYTIQMFIFVACIEDILIIVKLAFTDKYGNLMYT